MRWLEGWEQRVAFTEPSWSPTTVLKYWSNFKHIRAVINLSVSWAKHFSPQCTLSNPECCTVPGAKWTSATWVLCSGRPLWDGQANVPGVALGLKAAVRRQQLLVFWLLPWNAVMIRGCVCMIELKTGKLKGCFPLFCFWSMGWARTSAVYSLRQGRGFCPSTEDCLRLSAVQGLTQPQGAASPQHHLWWG